MRPTPLPYILGCNLMHGILYGGHGVLADEGTKTQHHPRHSMIAPLAGKIFELPDDRLQDFTGPKQAFSIMCFVAFFFDESQQLFAQLACPSSCW